MEETIAFETWKHVMYNLGLRKQYRPNMIALQVYTCILHSCSQYLKSYQFGRVAFSYSTVRPPFDINFSWSLSYIRKLAVMSHWGYYFTPFYAQPTCGAQEYQTCTDTAHLRVPVYTLSGV